MLPWLDTSLRLFGPNDAVQRPERTGSIKDLGVITHSSAFRRLAHKTQVFIDPDHDYVRTRLSHSLEASQIARELTQFFMNTVDAAWTPEERVEFENLSAHACLIHDIGHPPFGHLGERILQERLDPDFEGNKQNVRIIFGLGFPNRVLNLSRPLLDATLKYKRPLPSGKGPCYASEAAALARNNAAVGTGDARHPASYLMEAADDIAYLCGDLEDVLKMNLIDDSLRESFLELREIFPSIPGATLDAYLKTPADLSSDLMPALLEEAKRAIRAFATFATPDKDNLASDLDRFFSTQAKEPHFLYEGNARIKVLKHRIYHGGILQNPMVEAEREAAEEILADLVADYLDEFRKPPREIVLGVLAETLPHELLVALQTRDTFTPAEASVWLRDFIAGMTDRYATRLWNQLRLAK